MSISTDAKKENEQYLVTLIIFDEQIELDAEPHDCLPTYSQSLF
jgi:hypothetical protein